MCGHRVSMVVGKWPSELAEEVFEMLWTIIAILLIVWLLGLLFNFGGGLIHLLLVVATVVLIIQLLTGRSVTV